MEDNKRGAPRSGTRFHGTYDQRRAIKRWENAGWFFLHWTEVPRMVAVIENSIGDVAFIDHDGRAWTGPRFCKADPVPPEEYPPEGPEEWMAT